MTFWLNIAGMSVSISTKGSFRINKKLRSFSCQEKNVEDLGVTIHSCDFIWVPEKAVKLDNSLFYYKSNLADGDISFYLWDTFQKQAIYQLKVNQEWNKAQMIYQKEQDIRYALTGPLGEILFRNALLRHSGLVIHAAAIEWEGKGILFSAASGTGKTTQAQLWKKHQGAKILNADRPAVRLWDQGVKVYGSPWNGSSKKYKNSNQPLRAIILLEQGKENKIQRLDYKEAISRLMPRCFLPYFEPELMEIALKHLETLIMRIPIYLLRCRPDKEAVELVYQWVK